MAWMTVEWSRSNSRAIWESESGVSSRVRNIARCRARATVGVRLAERRSAREMPSTDETASWIALTVGATTEPGAGRASASVGPRAWSIAAAGKGLVEDGGDREDAGERALEPADVARSAIAISRRTSGSGSSSTASEAKRQSRATRVRRSGGVDLDGEAPLEAVAKALLERGQGSRRPVARDHDLLAGREQGVEGVDELLLGALLALEELDVVDEQRVEPAVALLEALGSVGPKRGRRTRW